MIYLYSLHACKRLCGGGIRMCISQWGPALSAVGALAKEWQGYLSLRFTLTHIALVPHAAPFGSGTSTNDVFHMYMYKAK